MKKIKTHFVLIIAVAAMVACGPRCASAQGFPFSLGGDEPQMETRSEVQYATTPDGWKLALEHVPPAFGGEGKVPVILCHGLGYNGDFWMLSRTVNLAQYLADQGYDVWILSLRGAGKSSKWVYKLAEVGMEAPGVVKGINGKDYTSAAIQGLGLLFKLSQAKLTNASANPKYINWTFDDYVNFDVPTAIEYVKQQTGSPEVFWIGHSMGGNVMLAHLATNQRNDLRGVVTVGSQLTMSNGHVVSRYLSTMQWLRLLELKGGVDKEKARQDMQEQARALLFNQSNMESDIIQRLETSGTDIPAVGVMGQYMELLGSGEFKTSDNQFNYARNAHNITVPILATCGSQDAFVNANDLAFLGQNISSEDKHMLIWGPQMGMYPFGHNDALISRRAVQQVYPVMLQWLNEHSGSAPLPPPGPRARPSNQSTYNPGATYQQPSENNEQDHRRPMKALPALEY